MGSWGQARIVNLGAELSRLRESRGLSYRALAQRARVNHSLLWKIEKGRASLTRDVAEACDHALHAGGVLVSVWEAARERIKPAQLPAAPPRVVGREAELAALTIGINGQTRGTPAVVVIDGPAGVGKTALALRWAHQVADQYVDGQLYADMRGFAPSGQPVSADTVLEEFLSAMGAPSIPDTLAKRASLYRSLLAERKVLVVLDNVADVDDVEPLLPASAGCAVVVTSRRIMVRLVGGLGGTRVVLAPLAERHSIELIRHVIGEGRADAESESVVTLAQLCGQLPVALRAVADQLTICPHRSVASLVDELLEADHCLSALATVDLRAMFSSSYHALDADSARLFRLMGLHLGPHLSEAAVAALAGITRRKARRLVHSLASVHLVEPGPDHGARMPELIHAYARELVTTKETGEWRAAAVRRLVSWYVATLHEATRHLTSNGTASQKPPTAIEGVEPLTFTDALDAGAWCDTEKTNCASITTLALQHGPPDAAHHLETALNAVDRCGHTDRNGNGKAPTPPEPSRPTGGQDPPPAQHDDDEPPRENGLGRTDQFTQPRPDPAPPWLTGATHGLGESPSQGSPPWPDHGSIDNAQQPPRPLSVDASNDDMPDSVANSLPEPPCACSRRDDDSVVPPPRCEPDAYQAHVPETAA